VGRGELEPTLGKDTGHRPPLGTQSQVVRPIADLWFAAARRRAHLSAAVLTAVHPENRVGFRPLEKVGTRPVGFIGYVGIGSLRWHFCRRCD